MEETTAIPDSSDETLNESAPTTEMVETPATGETPATTEPQHTASDEMQKELASLKAALKKANAESKEHRLKAKELDELKAQAEAAKLSETEKLQKKITDLQSQYDTATRQSQERTINYEVRLQAAQLGIMDPNDAVKLLDWSEIEYGDNGAPTNVQDLLQSLVKAKPYLVSTPSRPTSTSGGATNPSRSTTVNASQAINADFIKALTPDKYSHLSAEQRTQVQEWMLNNKQSTRR